MVVAVSGFSGGGGGRGCRVSETERISKKDGKVVVFCAYSCRVVTYC